MNVDIVNYREMWGQMQTAINSTLESQTLMVNAHHPTTESYRRFTARLHMVEYLQETMDRIEEYQIQDRQINLMG